MRLGEHHAAQLVRIQDGYRRRGFARRRYEATTRQAVGRQRGERCPFRRSTTILRSSRSLPGRPQHTEHEARDARAAADDLSTRPWPCRRRPTSRWASSANSASTLPIARLNRRDELRRANRSRAAALTRTLGRSSAHAAASAAHDLTARGLALAETAAMSEYSDSKTSWSRNAARSSGASRSSTARNATDRSEASSVVASVAGAPSREARAATVRRTPRAPPAAAAGGRCRAASWS